VGLIIHEIEASVDIANPFVENPIELFSFVDDGGIIEIISFIQCLYYIHNLEVSSMDSIPLSLSLSLPQYPLN
jgi:hypothetical protein